MTRRASCRNILAHHAALNAVEAAEAARVDTRPSPELVAIVARLEEARETMREASAELTAALQRWREAGGDPGRPEALLQQEGDIALCLYASQPASEDVPRTYTATAVEHYRCTPRIRIVEHQRPATGTEGFSADKVATDLNFIVTRRRAPWPEAQARADAIVAAWDAWTAETERRREAFDLPRLFHAEAEAGSAVCALLREARDFPARTLADLIAKACVTVDEVGSADGLVEAMAEADTWSEELALSLVRGLLAFEREA